MSYESPKRAHPPVVVHLPRSALVLLALLVVGPWGVVVALLVSPRQERLAVASSGADVPTSPVPKKRLPVLPTGGLTDGKPGPWGQLQHMHFTLEFPDELLQVQPTDQKPLRWFFRGLTKEQALDFLRASGVSGDALASVSGKAEWTVEPDGVWATPGDEWIVDLGPDARKKIYARLVECPQNDPQINPICFRTAELEDRIAGRGLKPSSVELFRRLVYRYDAKLSVFADMELVLRRLTDDVERRKFVKMANCTWAAMARLKIAPDSNLEGMLNYWSAGGRRKDVTPLLEGLQRFDGGWNLSIVVLIPPFMRDRIYTHPYPPAGANAPVQNCYWTAFNTFNERPDDRFSDVEYARRVLESDYYRISEPNELGDIIFLATKDGSVIHAMAYVAEDLVFTKNGTGPCRPWLLMHLPDVVDMYSVKYPSSSPLEKLYFRRKSG